MCSSKQMSQEVLFGVKLVTKVPVGFLVRLGTKVAQKVTRCDLFYFLIKTVFAYNWQKTQHFVDLISVFLAVISTPHACFSLFFRLLIAALSSVQACPSWRKITNFSWPIIIIAWFIRRHLVHMKKTRTVTELFAENSDPIWDPEALLALFGTLRPRLINKTYIRKYSSPYPWTMKVKLSMV